MVEARNRQRATPRRHLRALRSLAGTDYWPSFDGAILFLEEVKLRSAEVHGIDEALTHLQLLGVFSRLAGIIVGKVYGLSPEENRQLDDLLLRYSQPYHFPVLTRVDFGHTDPRLTLCCARHLLARGSGRRLIRPNA